MQSELIICGAGGQGILLAGTLLAHAALKENMNVTWLPSYGAEKRVGVSFCGVVISDKEIASPFVINADYIIGLDNVGFNAYEKNIKENGVMIINSSLIKREIKTDCRIIKISMNDIAKNVGDTRIVNMVALGVYAAITKVLKLESITDSLKDAIAPKYHNMLDVNKKALAEGFRQAERG